MHPFVSVDRTNQKQICLYKSSMPKKAAPKKTTKKTVAKKKHILLREIPTLHSLVTILYILLGILFIAIYITRFA